MPSWAATVKAAVLIKWRRWWVSLGFLMLSMIVPLVRWPPDGCSVQRSCQLAAYRTGQGARLTRSLAPHLCKPVRTPGFTAHAVMDEKESARIVSALYLQ